MSESLDPERLEETRDIGQYYADFLAVMNAFHIKDEEAAAMIVGEIYDSGPNEMLRFVTVMSAATLGLINALSQWSGTPSDQILTRIGHQQAFMNAEVDALIEEARRAQDDS